MAELEKSRKLNPIEDRGRRAGSKRRLLRRYLSELGLMAGFVVMLGALIVVVYLSLD